MSEELKPCQHGRNFCMECHYADLPPGKTLPKMYDDLLADNAKLRAQLHSLQGAGEAIAEVVSAHGDPEAFGSREIKVIADLSKLPYNTKLYTAPPAIPADPDRVQVPRKMLERAIKLMTETAFMHEPPVLSCQKGVVISCACAECATDRAIDFTGELRAILSSKGDV